MAHVRLPLVVTAVVGLVGAQAAPGAGLTLPDPRIGSGPSVSEALEARRSVRQFRQGPITLGNAGQLLWAAQGQNRPERRTAPSAGGLYPLTAYLVAGAVADLPAGIYRYLPAGHRLEKVAEGDRRDRLADAALGQPWVRRAPAAIVLTGAYSRTTGKYGERGRRYVHMEAGHAGQNVYLQAEALDLGTVMVGAFSDKAVARLLGVEGTETPLAIMPVGRAEPDGQP